MNSEGVATSSEPVVPDSGAQRRLGLALSGGGFRAAFFHIGVLARMAEMRLLRHVEVISTVSGGSIVGALYYLQLKQLLESQTDSEIDDQQYVEVVKDVEGAFTKAVQRNLRMLTFANPWHNVKMAKANYSRSDRIGELYDKYIYRPALSGPEGNPIEMRQLKIIPQGNPQGSEFNPTEPNHNSNRSAKVPILLINATALNTGHSWQFTATYMGELPPTGPLIGDIDKNTRLRRGSYDEITRRQQDFPLGLAVAASAGVPGLFPPLAVSELYGGWRVELVDGGVFDNQGISGLNDPEYPCTDFIVSDASGQMQDESAPDTTLLAVLSRTMNVLTGRVRDETVKALHHNNDGDRVAYVHLTRGLNGYDKPFIRSDDKPDAEKTREAAKSSAEFGVEPEVQLLLSRIRTDLDSFTDIEARALEADGYLMSGPALERMAANFQAETPGTFNWPFAEVVKRLGDVDDAALRKHLDVAAHKVFKPYRFGLSLGVGKALGLAGVSAIAAVAMSLYLVLIWYAIELFLPGWLHLLLDFLKGCLLDGETVLAILLAVFLGLIGEWLGKTFKTLRQLRSPARFILGLATRFVLPALGAVPVLIYLATIDRYFIKVLGR